MTPKHTESIADVDSERPCPVINLEMKLRVIKDYEGGNPVMVIARQSDMSHSTIATILKNKNKVTEALNRICFIEGSEINKNSITAYIRYGETSNDLD